MVQIQIEQIKKAIHSFFVERDIRIDKTIFFGPYNYGTPSEDSEIELIILPYILAGSIELYHCA